MSQPKALIKYGVLLGEYYFLREGGRREVSFLGHEFFFPKVVKLRLSPTFVHGGQKLSQVGQIQDLVSIEYHLELFFITAPLARFFPHATNLVKSPAPSPVKI